MLYDVAPGVILETDDDRILDEDELAKARERYEGGASLEDVARKIRGARPWTPPDRERAGAGVVVDLAQLVAALGEEKAAELLGARPGEAVPG